VVPAVNVIISCAFLEVKRKRRFGICERTTRPIASADPSTGACTTAWWRS